MKFTIFDQTFNDYTLSKLFYKSEIGALPAASKLPFKKAVLKSAVKAAESKLQPLNPIIKFHLKKKTAYRIAPIHNELVIRKLSRNIKQFITQNNRGRSYYVKNLRNILEEPVPYRVYRIDIKSFYESFLSSDILSHVLGLNGLSPLSKSLFVSLLKHYQSIGGTGLPRGMAISAVLSDLMMTAFDEYCLRTPDIFFYCRYVDDIIVVTSSKENESNFLTDLCTYLPHGLVLNEKKQDVIELGKAVTVAAGPSPVVKKMDYLGYELLISEPIEAKKVQGPDFRIVKIEIAKAKIKKIKIKITKSLLDYAKVRNFDLLMKRIKFLTSNFSIYDEKTGQRKLAGIYYNYPLLSDDSTSLKELDQYLRAAILSRSGRTASTYSIYLNRSQRNILLANSFQNGHSGKIFVHYPPTLINEVQKCWKYE